MYRYLDADSVLYVVPLKSEVLIKGILKNDKAWYEYVKEYADKGFDFEGSPNMDWDIGWVNFTTSTDGPAKPFTSDTLYYMLSTVSNIPVLDAFSLHSNKLEVGGLRVGMSISNVLNEFGLVIEKPINKLIIGNYHEIYYSMMSNCGTYLDKAEFFSNFRTSEIPYDKNNYELWEDLPYGIEIRFINSVLINIRTPLKINRSNIIDL